MACIALKRDNKVCRNYAPHVICAQHACVPFAELKRRWISRYFKSANYTYREGKYAEYVLAPLRTNLFTLEPKDFTAISPNNLGAIDVYLLLLREGYVTPSCDMKLFKRAILFHLSLATVARESHYLYNFAQNVFFNTSMNLFETSISTILGFCSAQATPSQLLYGAHPQTQIVLKNALKTEVARMYSWTSPEILLEELLTKEPVPSVEMCSFVRTTILPELLAMYKEEKEIQRTRMDYHREELMAITWRPERVMEHLNMGYTVDAM